MAPVSAPPTHKNEQTGNVALDRIQSNVRDIVAYVRNLKIAARLASLEARSETNGPKWSPATEGASLGVTATAGNFTTGVQFSVGRSVNCTGLRFYGVAAAAKTVKAKIYDAGGVLLASSAVTISRSGTYLVKWPVAVKLKPFALYRVAVYQIDGLNYYAYPAASANAPARPFYAGGAVVLNNIALFLGGDVAPTNTAAGEAYPVEPVLS